MQRPALLVLAALAAACPSRLPVDFGTRGRITDPAEMTAILRTRNDRLKAIQGDAKVSITTPEGSGKVAAYVVASTPNRLRFETLSFFGSPLAVLTTDGETFRLHDVEKNTLREGPATPANVSRLLPVIMRPEELVDLLLGRVPVPTADAKLEVDDVARRYLLSFESDGVAVRVGIDPLTLRPVLVERPPNAGLSPYAATFDGYADDTQVPGIIRVLTPDGRFAVEFAWKGPELDPELGPKTFTIDVPDSVNRVGP